MIGRVLGPSHKVVRVTWQRVPCISSELLKVTTTLHAFEIEITVTSFMSAQRCDLPRFDNCGHQASLMLSDVGLSYQD